MGILAAFFIALGVVSSRPQAYGYGGHGIRGHSHDEKDEEEVCETSDTPKVLPPIAKHICSLNKEPGHCDKAKSKTELKYHWNPHSSKCELFVYSGCGGNDNRFDTELGCNLFCDPKPEKEPKPCKPKDQD